MEAERRYAPYPVHPLTRLQAERRVARRVALRERKDKISKERALIGVGHYYYMDTEFPLGDDNTHLDKRSSADKGGAGLGPELKGGSR